MALGEGIRDASILVVGPVLTGHAFDCSLGGIRGHALHSLVPHDSGREFLLSLVKTSSRASVDSVHLYEIYNGYSIKTDTKKWFV